MMLKGDKEYPGLRPLEIFIVFVHAFLMHVQCVHARTHTRTCVCMCVCIYNMQVCLDYISPRQHGETIRHTRALIFFIIRSFSVVHLYAGYKTELGINFDSVAGSNI